MTGPLLVIEPMARRDIPAVSALDVAVYPNPWSNATWRRELESADRHHLIARVGPEVIGHAGLLFVLDEVHVTTVAVHPDHGGRGIGTRLVLELLDEARRHGADAATLEVRASHRRTQRVYSRFGFRPVGARTGYYSTPTEDAIVMWLHGLQSDATTSRLDAVRAELTAVDA